MLTACSTCCVCVRVCVSKRQLKPEASARLNLSLCGCVCLAKVYIRVFKLKLNAFACKQRDTRSCTQQPHTGLPCVCVCVCEQTANKLFCVIRDKGDNRLNIVVSRVGYESVCVWFTSSYVIAAQKCNSATGRGQQQIHYAAIMRYAGHTAAQAQGRRVKGKETEAEL